MVEGINKQYQMGVSLLINKVSIPVYHSINLEK